MKKRYLHFSTHRTKNDSFNDLYKNFTKLFEQDSWRMENYFVGKKGEEVQPAITEN